MAGAAALLVGAGLQLPASPAQAVEPAIHNGGVELGQTGWSTNTARDVLTTSTSAHSGQQSLRVHAQHPRSVRTRATTAGTIAPGHTATVRTWVRPITPGQRVRLEVRETVDGAVVQKSATTIHPAANTWTQVRTALVPRTPDSLLTVQVVAPRSTRPVDLLLDDTTLRASASPAPAPPTNPGTAGPLLTNGCEYDVRGIPACGAYLGATVGSNSDPATLESQLGRRLGVRRTFWTAPQVDKAVQTAKADVAHGRVPWISFKLPYSWEAMTAGQGDAWARDLATKLAAVPGPVWVAFHHEPEGDGNIQAWRTMQERLAPIVHKLAPNVAYTVVVTGWNQFYGAAQYSLANIWPRGVKIDVAGFDLYNEYGVIKNGKKNMTWPNFDRDYFAKIQTWATQQGVAWGLAETAYTDDGHVYDPAWITKTYNQLVARGGTAMAYFNTTLNAYGTWQLATASKRASLAAPLRDSAAMPVSDSSP